MTTEIACITCKTPLSANEFLSGCQSWSASLDCVQFRCPRCGGSDEIQIQSGRVSHGYIYAAGSAHFSPQLTRAVPSLQVNPTDHGLDVTLEGAHTFIRRA